MNIPTLPLISLKKPAEGQSPSPATSSPVSDISQVAPSGTPTVSDSTAIPATPVIQEISATPTSTTPDPISSESLDPALQSLMSSPTQAVIDVTQAVGDTAASGSASATPATVTTPPATEDLPASSPTPVPDPTFSSTSQLGTILVRDGKLQGHQVSQLEVEHMQTGKSVDDLIEEKKLVDEEGLSRAKAEIFNVPFVKLAEIGISPEALNTLSETVARRYNILPFAINSQDRTLSVAMRNPLDLAAIDFAEEKSGFRLLVHYAMPSELERTIAERYAQSLSTEVTAALQETAQVAQQRQQAQQIVTGSTEIVRQAPITKIVETILAFAIKARASDVHIEPLEDRTRVRYRIDGILTEKLILPHSVHEATVSRIKILSDLKIDEKRIPQDGRFTFNETGEEVDLRISTLPTIHGEKVVMRLLKKNQQVPTLPDLGLTGLALHTLEDAIKVPHGIILVTGPTGSGKTTTLYSVLHEINTPKVNIMTLEDPVEYQMEGVNQVQINPQAGLTFASGLRSFLRQDPNIIMVGEIRDSETAELAIQASLTGHLVFSTLHTSSAAGALPRLLDMGAEPFLLASSMTLTMGQRVLRLINPDYKEEYTPEPAVVADIKAVLGDNYLKWCKEKGKDPENMVLYRPKADRPPAEPEYKGRVAIFEVMRITEEIGKLILERKSATDLEKVGIKNGMLLMKQDGYLKALEGMTTIEEVLRVAQV